MAKQQKTFMVVSPMITSTSGNVRLRITDVPVPHEVLLKMFRTPETGFPVKKFAEAAKPGNFLKSKLDGQECMIVCIWPE